jgi:hypothetical protein
MANYPAETQIADALAASIALLAALSDNSELPARFRDLLGSLADACPEEQALKRTVFNLVSEHLDALA